MKEADFYEKLSGKRVKCLLCQHYCIIAENKVGICQVRKNVSGKLFSLIYGYPVVLNIDPIEKKPLFHFFPGTQTYSLGTMGCNFKCANCLNSDISQAGNIAKKVTSLDFYTPQKIIDEVLSNDCPSISYTYNEPTIFAEYALEIMKLASQHNIKNVWVSNGFMSSELLKAILPYLDAINVDLKSFSDNFYFNNCSGKLAPVLENLKILKREQVHLEVSTLIIPTLSDSIEMISKLANFIATELDTDTPWHITKFSPNISWQLKDLPPTSEDIIYEAYEIGKDAGLKYVYVGNLPGDQKENTYCPKCSELAIRRMGYHIDRLDENGRCSYCDRDLDIIE